MNSLGNKNQAFIGYNFLKCVLISSDNARMGNTVKNYLYI